MSGSPRLETIRPAGGFARSHARSAVLRWLVAGALGSAAMVSVAQIYVGPTREEQLKQLRLQQDRQTPETQQAIEDAIARGEDRRAAKGEWFVHEMNQPQRAAPRRSALAATGTASANLDSFTPNAAFRGNQSAVVGRVLEATPGVGDAVFARDNGCALSQYAYPDRAAKGGAATVVLKGVEAHFRHLAGLAAAPSAYPKGCTDRAIGKSSTDTALLGTTGNGDLLVAFANDLGKITVTRISIAGEVVSEQILTTGAVPPNYNNAAYTFAVADLNGDGLADIVSPFWVAPDGSAGVAVFLSQAASGTYVAPGRAFGYGSAVSGYGARVAIEDIDGDGKLDLVAMDADVNTGGGVLMTLRGNGSGGFTAGSTQSLPSGVVGLPYVVADLDGDGRKDIVTASGYFLAGSSAGASFAAPARRLEGSFGATTTETIAVGDFNGDGRLDVALLNGLGYVNSRFVSIYLGNGDGNFSTGPVYATTQKARELSVTDVDGDGIADLWVGRADQGVYSAAYKSQSVMHFLLGRGDGTFAGAPARATSPLAYMPFAVADFDSDGKPDLVSLGISPTGDLRASSELLLSSGSATGDFGAAGLVATLSFTPRFVASGDLNGDGRPDVVVAGGALSALLGKAGGGFGAEQANVLAPGATVRKLAVGDVNGDGRSDVVVVTTTGIYVHYADVTGRLQAPRLVDAATDVTNLAVGDLNGDGRADIVLVGPDTPTPLRVYLGKADGSFAAPRQVAPPPDNRFGALAIADMNKDGKPDLVVALYSSTQAQVGILPGKGDGSFGAGTPYALLEDGTISALTVADFTFDGNPDVMVLREFDSVAVLHGDGAGKLVIETALAIAGASTFAIAADLNGDTVPDAVLATGLTGIVTLHRTAQAIGAGTPVDTPPMTFSASSLAGSVASGESVTTNLGFAFAPGFAETVSLSCSGLPANATCSFAPSSVVATGGAAASVLTIQTGTAAGAAVFATEGPGTGTPTGQQAATLAALLALVLTALHALRAGPGGVRVPLRHGLRLGTLAAAGWVAGCGGGNGGGTPAPAQFVTPSGTYDVTVTASSPGATQSLVYRLTVN